LHSVMMWIFPNSDQLVSIAAALNYLSPISALPTATIQHWKG